MILNIIYQGTNRSWKGDKLLIGSDAHCDVFLASPEISPRHATLTLKKGKFIFEGISSEGFTHNEETKHQVVIEFNDPVIINGYQFTLIQDNGKVGLSIEKLTTSNITPRDSQNPMLGTRNGHIF